MAKLTDNSIIVQQTVKYNKCAAATDARPGSAGIPIEFIELCEIKADTTSEDNVYHAPVRCLSLLLKASPSQRTGELYINFLSGVKRPFMDLLRAKDPRALLIMGHVYATALQSQQWWLVGRAKLECAAICMFLESCPDPSIRYMLRFPASACGYQLAEELPAQSFAVIPPGGGCSIM